jgi:NAD(P)-dependent dehydrogenase (short-subunit alcohol dehydrogenase family)
MTQDQTLADEVVLVTGAARGIGKAIAIEAAARGAHVGLVDIERQGVERTYTELTEAGAKACFVAADVTDEKSVAMAVESVSRTLGATTILVNNAGKNAYGDPVTLTVAEWNSVFAVDLLGAWLMSRAVLPDMKAAGSGSIVNIASLHATLTTAGMFPYAAAKAGLVGMTKSLALEAAADGVRVNAVSPGYIQTELNDEYFAQHDDPDVEQKAIASQPLGRLGTAQEVASVVCFLGSAQASFVTGANWSVDGGFGARFA